MILTIEFGRRLSVLLSLNTSVRTVEVLTERIGGRTTGVLVTLGPIALHLSWFDLAFPARPDREGPTT